MFDIRVSNLFFCVYLLSWPLIDFTVLSVIKKYIFCLIHDRSHYLVNCMQLCLADHAVFPVTHTFDRHAFNRQYLLDTV